MTDYDTLDRGIPIQHAAGRPVCRGYWYGLCTKRIRRRRSCCQHVQRRLGHVIADQARGVVGRRRVAVE